MGDGNDGGNGGVWVSIGEAARRLGISRQAVQGRLKRGTLETRMETIGNRQRLRVQLPQPLPQPAAPPVTQEATQPVALPVAAVPDAELLARAAVAEALVAELREQVAALRAELHREATQGLVERDRLLALLESALAERRPARRPWPGLRRWWRRVWKGEG